MGKIVLFTNLKGGTGKTTLCGQFAGWLSKKGKDFAVIDADIQQSLYRMRKRETESGEERETWQVAAMDTGDVKLVRENMKKLKAAGGTFLIDCPGTASDPGLRPIFEAADVAVIPMRFDDMTLDTTGVFIRVLKQISGAKLVFVPNRINVMEGRKREKARRDADTETLAKIGTVTPVVRQSVAVMRMSTVEEMSEEAERILKPAFEAVENIIYQ